MSVRGTASVVMAMSASLAVGCATVDPAAHFPDVVHAVDGRVPTAPVWPITDAERAAVDLVVSDLLSTPLTQDAAVKVALLNNRHLRASYAGLGVATADFVEAGLLDNPGFSFGAGFPDRAPSQTALDFGISINILRMLMLPAQRDIASVQLTAETLDVANAVLQTASDTRVMYVEVQAAMHLSSLLREITMAAEAAVDLAERIHAAGNMSDLELANQQVMYEQVRVELVRSQSDVADLRERLSAQLGVWGADTDWTIEGRLPELSPVEPDLAELESLAMRQRLDLAAAAKRVEVLSRAAGLQREWRGILATDVGFLASRDTDGQWVYGPEFSMELPVFNQRQADVARLDAALLGAESHLEALAIDTRADVRRLRDRLYALRYEVEHYRSTLIPLRERVTQLTQQEYNFMLVDTFALLAAKRDEIGGFRDYVNAIQSYWSVRAELERVVGGRLPQTEAMTPGMDSTHEEMRMPPTSDARTDHHRHGEH